MKWPCGKTEGMAHPGTGASCLTHAGCSKSTMLAV
jgi:hypothetical protein